MKSKTEMQKRKELAKMKTVSDLALRHKSGFFNRVLITGLPVDSIVVAISDLDPGFLQLIY